MATEILSWKQKNTDFFLIIEKCWPLLKKMKQKLLNLEKISSQI
jgi:hypothetical protein